MRIKQKVSQHRRDFMADYECDSCGHIVRASGYDDSYFHEHVIPAMPCPKCGVRSARVSSEPDVPSGVVL
jgi:predicted RNA-binding Zn-ribbon protein involved in translation (DUF1610 family)